jgi:hypothetical protein
MPDTWADAAARIAARWDHGHDELTDGCALCQAEYAEARAWALNHPGAPNA